MSLSTVISGVPLFWKYEGDQQLETKVVGASGTHLNILVQKIVPTRLLSSLIKHYFNYGQWTCCNQTRKILQKIETGLVSHLW